MFHNRLLNFNLDWPKRFVNKNHEVVKEMQVKVFPKVMEDR